MIPATFRFVAQHLNHCATAVPHIPYYTTNKHSCVLTIYKHTTLVLYLLCLPMFIAVHFKHFWLKALTVRHSYNRESSWTLRLSTMNGRLSRPEISLNSAGWCGVLCASPASSLRQSWWGSCGCVLMRVLWSRQWRQPPTPSGTSPSLLSPSAATTRSTNLQPSNLLKTCEYNST